MPRSTETFMSVGTDGSITFDFTGHISAQGIDMLLSVFASPPNDRTIRWHFTTLTGESLVEVQAFRVGVTTEAVLMAFAPGRLTQTFLAVDQTNGAGTGANRVLAQSGVFPATIIDGVNNSSFLKLLTLGNLRIAFGQTSVNPTTSVDVNIGLAPVNVQLTIRAIGFPGGLSALNYDYQGANVIRVYNNNGFVIPFDWLAVG